MSKKIKAFSLIELLIVLTIVGLLATVSIPSYKNYVIKAKMVEFFTIADLHKLKLSEKIINGETAASINHIINNPSALVEQLEYIYVNPKKYILKLTANMVNLGITPIQGNPLIIKFIGEENTETNLMAWNCEHNPGFGNFVPKTCAESSE